DSGRTYTKFSSIKNRASQSTYGYASISHKCLEPGYDLSLGRTIHTYKLDVHTSQLVKQGKGGELVLLETGEFEETLRQLWYQHKGDPLIIENCRRRCAGGLYSLHMEAVVAILYLGFAIDRPEFVRRRHLLSVTVSRVPCEPCARLLLGLLARFPELVLRLKSSLLTADGTAGLKCLAAFQPPERLWFRFMPDDEVRRKFGPDEQSDAAEEVARWLHHQAGFQPSTAAPHPSLLELATSNLDVGALQDGVRVFVESQLRTVTLPALWNLLSERVLIQLLLVLAGGELDELLTKKVLTKKLTEKEMAYLRQCAGAAKKDESRPKVKRAAKPKDFANSLREAAKALATRAGDEATRKAIKKHVLDQIRISPSSWGQYQSKIKQATPAALDQEIETVKSLYRPFNVAGKSITLNWKEQGATRAELLTLAFPEQRALPEEREVELETGEKEEEGEYWASDEAAPEARCLFCGVEVPAFTQFCNSSCEELCLQSGDW
ncbi:MAG TPA: hypothetical protein VFQ61_12585, partial [Polyangiaceae bacterium]|nr:hypothetical protein [Polyangiaceae bacterium]